MSRGIEMNPIDHPHGGRKANRGRHPVKTPWGKIDQGCRTRSNKSTDKFIMSAAGTRNKTRKCSNGDRSVWKGPFVDGYLLKKAEKVREGGPQRD
jgi:hypothetical protein